MPLIIYTYMISSAVFSLSVFLTLFNVLKAYSLLTYTLAKNISIKQERCISNLKFLHDCKSGFINA